MGRYRHAMASVFFAALAFVGCSSESQNAESTTSEKSSSEQSSVDLKGSINIDGSSTVFPITAAVAEEFMLKNSNVRVAVSVSGTGGGFKKFDLGETDINNASRPITAKEIAASSANNVSFIELPVAYDGLTVIINPQNSWVDHLTVEELGKMWAPGSTVKKWSELRAGWPDQEIILYGAGTDSGTFDYFTEAINGKAGASRSDYTSTEDDNLTIQGVAGGVNALGYLGFAYFEQNINKVKAVPIKASDLAPVLPSIETIMNSTYTPLSRPLFIYVSGKSAERPEIAAFIDFYLKESADLVKEVGYIPLPETGYELVRKRFNERKTGTVFQEGVSTVGMSVEQLLSSENATEAPQKAPE